MRFRFVFVVDVRVNSVRQLTYPSEDFRDLDIGFQVCEVVD